MEAKFQSSFIPNKPVVSSGDSYNTPSKATRGFMYFFGSVIFTLSLLSAGGVFGYEKYLESQVNQMKQDLVTARERLDESAINELIDKNNRMKSGEIIINKHIKLTEFFNFLENITIKDLGYLSFSLKILDSNNQQIEIEMKGVTRTYKTLAVQADIFSKDQNLLDYKFSNLSLDEKGDVVFSTKLILNPELISYVRSLERSPGEFMQSQQGSVNTNVNDIDNEEQVSVPEETVSQQFNEGVLEEEQSS